ncbi:calcium-binding protein [Methylophilus sp. QUAN]|uniref:calcium-binding protein n=1 Tax=Methylophilus sp. QUAN TaxID=2781020 RepID=UPI0018903C87|nr:calcium-binding protein [Methylophilus sp. QUAN]MBF4991845.1 calcium-binding protein [Methylophilus sp. QUAN]
MSYTKKMTVVGIFMLPLISSVSIAQPDLDTGGYARELQTMEMMEMIDANNNQMVSKMEFNTYYTKLFVRLDKNKDNYLDEKEWIGEKEDHVIAEATGGYLRELRSMKVMGAMDADANGKVSLQEFLSFNEVIFNRMDIKQEGEVDPGNWLSKQTHY